MPLLCWHYTPSLWPWSLWTLSCTVSMTTTQQRLLVTCVGGFACSEWKLHNRLNRESLWQCSALWNQNQFHGFCNGTIIEHVAEDGEAVFLFTQTSIIVILAHYIIAVVDLSLQPLLRFSAVPEAHSWPVRGAKKNAFEMSLSSW